MIPTAKLNRKCRSRKVKLPKAFSSNLSESWPKIGVAINCIMENEAVRTKKNKSPWLRAKPFGKENTGLLGLPEAGDDRIRILHQEDPRRWLRR